MAQLKCIKAAKIEGEARFLEPGAFWQAGDTYTVRLLEAQELLTLFPTSFEPLDDEAKVAADRAKG